MPMIAPKYDTRRPARRDRVKLRPTVAAGTPMGAAAMPAPTGMPDQQIPEPALVVGEQSGTVYSRFGDNPNGPEQVQVIPPAGPVPLRRGNMVRSFATGGTMEIGGNTAVVRPLTPEEQARINAQQASPGANAVATAPTTDPLVRQTQAREATQGANQAVINASQGVTAANNNVVNARAGTIAPTQSVIDAGRGVAAATDQYIAGNRGYIQTRQQADAARLADEQAVQAARSNVADLTATARAQTDYNDQKYRFNVAGVTPDTEVQLPDGTNAQLGPGVRGKIMSQADLLANEQQSKEAIRAIELSQARNALDLVGTNVDAARNEAAKAGLTLDQAQLVVSQAQLEADRAGITLDQYQNQLSQARLNEDIAGNKPAGQVLYTDPYTGRSEYVTQAVADQRDFQYRNSAPGGQFIYDEATGTYAPAELGRLSDAGVAAFGVGDDSAFGPFQNPYQGMPAAQRREMAVQELVRRGYSEGLASYLVDSAIVNSQPTQQGPGGIVE